MSVVLAGISALCFGVADFIGAAATRRAPLLSVLLLSQLAGTAMALGFVILARQPLPAALDLGWGMLGGLGGAFGLLLLYRGLSKTVVAIVAPSAALFGALLPAAFGLVWGEVLGTPTLLGALLCLPAVLLMSWERPGGAPAALLRSALVHGIAAGCAIGLMLLAVSRSSPDSGLWPMISARASSMSVFAIALVLTRGRPRVPGRALAPVLGAGLADMGGNILFLIAVRGGLLSVTSIVTSLFPAPTVILARLVWKERIPPARLAGLLLALAGVALIGWGQG